MTFETKLKFLIFLGGTAGVYVSQPLDTVKVKMQTFPQLYNNMVDCFIKTYKRDGIARGLYAGSVPTVLANCSENAVLFAGELLKKSLLELLNSIF